MANDDATTPTDGMMSGGSRDTTDAVSARTYDAMISYHSASDGELSKKLRDKLVTFARDRGRLRALDIYRDRDSGIGSPLLRDGLAEAVRGARFLILLARNEAANSDWVKWEILEWSRQRRKKNSDPAKQLILVWTGGDFAFTRETRAIDWKQTSALPMLLSNPWSDPEAADHEHLPIVLAAHTPHIHDLRPAISPPSNRNTELVSLDLIADISALIRKKDRADLLSSEILNDRRRRRTRGGIIVALTILALVTAGIAIRLWFTSNTLRQRNTELSNTQKRLTEALTERQRQLAESLWQQGITAREVSHDPIEAAHWFFQAALAATDDISLRQSALIAARSSRERIAGTWLEHGTLVGAKISDEGKRVLTWTTDGAFTVWEEGRLKPVGKFELHIPIDVDGNGWRVAFSSDGRAVSAYSNTEGAYRWSVASNRAAHPLLAEEPRRGLPIMSGDGSWIGKFRFGENTFSAWQLGSRSLFTDIFGTTQRQRVFTVNHEGPIDECVASDDGSRFITKGSKGVRVWDAKGNAICEISDSVRKASFMWNARRLVTFSEDNRLRVYDISAAEIAVTTHRSIETIDFETSMFLDVVACVDAPKAAVIARDGTVHVYSFDSNRPQHRAFQHDGVIDVSFANQGKLLVTRSRIGDFKTWTTDNVGHQWVPLPSIVVRRGEEVGGVVVSPRGSRLVSWTRDGTVRSWHLNQTVLEPFPDVLFGNSQLSVDGRRLAGVIHPKTTPLIRESSPTQRSIVEVLDIASKRTLFRRECEAPFCLSPDGATIFLGGARAELWSLDRGCSLATMPSHLNSTSFAEDSRRIVARTPLGSVHVFDLGGRDLLHIENLEASSFKLSGDGRRIFHWNSSGPTHVWDVDDQMECHSIPTGGPSVVVSMSGHWLVTVGKAIDVWDVDACDIRFSIADATSAPIFLEADRLAVPLKDRIEVWDIVKRRVVWATDPIGPTSFLRSSRGLLLQVGSAGIRIFDLQRKQPVLAWNNLSVRDAVVSNLGDRVHFTDPSGLLSSLNIPLITDQVIAEQIAELEAATATRFDAGRVRSASREEQQASTSRRTSGR